MNRRDFMKGAAACTAGSALPTPAEAGSVKPPINMGSDLATSQDHSIATRGFMSRIEIRGKFGFLDDFENAERIAAELRRALNAGEVIVQTRRESDA